MKNTIKKLLTEPPRGVTGGHGVLLAIVGGYLIYMCVKMVQNTLSGVSTMSMTTTVILVAIMGLVGLAVVAYGGLIFYWSAKKQPWSGAASSNTVDAAADDAELPEDDAAELPEASEISDDEGDAP